MTASSGSTAGAGVVHTLGGIVWLYGLGAALDESFGIPAAVLWVGSALVLWLRATMRIGDRESPWRTTFLWWASTLVAPVALGVVVLRRAGGRGAAPAPTAAPASTRPATKEALVSSPAVLARLDAAELRLRSLEAELRDLRALVGAPSPERAAAPAAAPAPAPSPAAAARPVTASSTPARARREPRWRPPTISTADLLGARGLAWAGGLVSLLGVVFFFVLAVNRGWIGPGERVLLGALASAALVALGLLARHRYGQLHAALAAVGAGLAGGYATLLAAAALYDLLPPLVALGLAAAIAAVGIAVALAWSSELVAGIGLVGSALVPLSALADGGISALGTAFAAIVFAAATLVAWRREWSGLAVAAFAATLPQVWLLVAQKGEGASAAVVAVALSYVVLYVGAAVRLQRPGAPLDPLASALALASASLAAIGAPVLLNGDWLGLSREGVALLVLAPPYAVLAAVLFARRRDLALLCAAAAMVLSGLGFAELLGGGTLAALWALQGAAFAWLASRVHEPRFAVASLAYLALAVGHALAIDAPPSALWSEAGDPAGGIATVLLVAAGLVVAARAAAGWGRGELRGLLAAQLGAVADEVARRRAWAVVLAGVGVVYAASLGALALVETAGIEPAFPWGHVAVTALWAAAGAVAFALGSRRGSRLLLAAGVGGLGATLAQILLFDVGRLPLEQAGWAAFAGAVGLLGGGYLAALARPAEEWTRLGARAAVAASALPATIAIVDLLREGDVEARRGIGFLAAAVVYGALSATIFARPTRDEATVLWALAVAGGLAAALLLLDGTVLVAVLAGGAVALVVLARAAAERRLEVAAAVPLGAGALVTLVALAPPRELFLANASPADGAAAVAFVALALALWSWLAATRAFASDPGDALDAAVDGARPRAGRILGWSAGVGGLYAGALAILGLVAWLGNADVTTEFQRGHTAVSAFLGAAALAALSFGVRRGWPSLRVAGFALFGGSLAKLFLYDLSTLTSVARALSFLAVGVVLLLAGFFYQRLTSAAR